MYEIPKTKGLYKIHAGKIEWNKQVYFKAEFLL